MKGVKGSVTHGLTSSSKNPRWNCINSLDKHQILQLVANLTILKSEDRNSSSNRYNDIRSGLSRFMIKKVCSERIFCKMPCILYLWAVLKFEWGISSLITILVVRHGSDYLVFLKHMEYHGLKCPVNKHNLAQLCTLPAPSWHVAQALYQMHTNA